MNTFSGYLFFSPDTFDWLTETTCDTKEIGINNGFFYNKKVKATESAVSGYVTEMIDRNAVSDSSICPLIMEEIPPLFPELDNIDSTSANIEGNKRPLFSNHESCNKSGNGDISIEIKMNEPDAQIENSTKVLHTVKKSFQCNVCEKSFNRKHNLEEHIRTHTGVMPFKCNVCEKSFNRKQNLEVHIRTHTGVKPFKCNVCEKSFRYFSGLTIHTLRIHTGERPFKCEFCDRRFVQRCELKNHIRIHTGERPFKCEVCKESFREANSLKKHTRTHTGERPYKCELCDKSYIQKSGLISHTRCLHSSEKPFKCEVCEICFALKNQLTRHQKTKRHLKKLAELSST
ncbi:C2H2-type zinc finger protein [Endozoicomonas sp. GU-1]|uniref:C2H2-type zinc finger protein n=1 Tax=Endozoicomonas sp. GU-1 TaxID=3009078 RepID=UPI0022B40F4B|nr:C2H2-type zinc finger protein [Endozoicomonas sp. GU-1]WBA82859.1 C2H2-type zinc finger protein [Endozoicomonas sp. GU-1]WBA85787.1 C2H2-type zinc finger protein [Endozoicomonas sp. GU-1]